MWIPLSAAVILSTVYCALFELLTAGRHLGIAMCPEKDNKAGERTREQILWKAGVVWSEKRGKVGEDIIAISLTT